MKRRITTKKGTASEEQEIGPLIWSEEEFLKIQEEKMNSLPKGLTISLGKGTGRLVASEYPKLPRKIAKAKFLVSNKGTSSIRLS